MNSVAALIFAALPVALIAQWPAYPVPAVPKLANGKPNMDAPTPRTADGKPDLSGLWEKPRRTPSSTIIAGSGPGLAAPPSLSGAAAAPAARPNALSQFFYIGATLKDGLPFTPWGEALRKERLANNDKDNPDAHCLPLGLIQLHNHTQPRKIIEAPGLILILYEAQGGVRQIFMDGRPLPNSDAEPWWYGYSIGKWDGDTLVVETTGFRDDVWLDISGSPLTSSGKMTERFRRPNYGHLEIEITVEDPKAYTKPWTVQINQLVMPNEQLIEFICNENEKSDAHLVGK